MSYDWLNDWMQHHGVRFITKTYDPEGPEDCPADWHIALDTTRHRYVSCRSDPPGGPGVTDVMVLDSAGETLRGMLRIKR